MPDKPQLLFLMQRLPFPLIKGEKIRNWHILKYLAKWYDIHFGCLIDDPEDEQYIPIVRALCKSMYTAPLNKKWAKFTAINGLFLGEPLSVTYFHNQGLQSWVEEIIAYKKPVMTFVNSSNMAPYILDHVYGGKRVIELGDIDSEKFRAYAKTANPVMRYIYQRECRMVQALERRIALESDHSVLVSEDEANMLRYFVPQAAQKIVGISNGVDHRYFAPQDYDRPYDIADLAHPTYVFTGTMDYTPNIEAVVWFVTKVLPIIQKSYAARFYIVGNSPTKEVKNLENHQGVTVTGRVPDVRPYVAHATAVVCPMTIARGIQNKVLEAMAMQKPVILTSGALEGISAVDGREVIVANDASTFAMACMQMIGGLKAGALGIAARQLILERYDWQACLSGFDAIMKP